MKLSYALLTTVGLGAAVAAALALQPVPAPDEAQKYSTLEMDEETLVYQSYATVESRVFAPAAAAPAPAERDAQPAPTRAPKPAPKPAPATAPQAAAKPAAPATETASSAPPAAPSRTLPRALSGYRARTALTDTAALWEQTLGDPALIGQLRSGRYTVWASYTDIRADYGEATVSVGFDATQVTAERPLPVPAGHAALLAEPVAFSEAALSAAWMALDTPAPPLAVVERHQFDGDKHTVAVYTVNP